MLETKLWGSQGVRLSPRDIQLVNGEAEFKSRPIWLQIPHSPAVLHYPGPETRLHAAPIKAWLLPSLWWPWAREHCDTSRSRLRHWHPTSADDGGFAHSKKCSSPWWESSQQLLLGNSHSSLMPDAHGAALLFYMWKMRKGPEPQHRGNDERPRSISKVTRTERSIRGGGGGG